MLSLEVTEIGRGMAYVYDIAGRLARSIDLGVLLPGTQVREVELCGNPPGIYGIEVRQVRIRSVTRKVMLVE